MRHRPELSRRTQRERSDPAPVRQRRGKVLGRRRLVVAGPVHRLPGALRPGAVVLPFGQDTGRRRTTCCQAPGDAGLLGPIDRGRERLVSGRLRGGHERHENGVGGRGRGNGRGRARFDRLQRAIGLVAPIDGVDGIVHGQVQHGEHTRFGERIRAGSRRDLGGDGVPAKDLVRGALGGRVRRERGEPRRAAGEAPRPGTALIGQMS